MVLDSHCLTDGEKREICSWRYEGKYKAYNLPSFEEMQRRDMSFVKPECEKNYRGYYHESSLVGYTSMREEVGEVFVGIGVKPDLCNRGYGRLMLEEACNISKYLYPKKSLCLEVRTWNQRAINCYLKAGFRINGEPYRKETGSGVGMFYRMVRE